MIGNSGTLLNWLKLGGSLNKADVVLGIDSNDSDQAIEKKYFQSSEVKMSVITEMKLSPRLGDLLVPFDQGVIAVMWDSEKLKDPPKNMDELISRKDLQKKLILPDPRFSSPGLAFMHWMKFIYGGNWSKKLPELRQQVLTVTPGWSEAYGLFVKGEAPLVVSYLTSEAYHRIVEKTDRYRALLFSSHLTVAEYAGVLSSSPNRELAIKFIDFLLKPSSQKIIAEKNWMLPMINASKIPGINPWFLNLNLPSVQPIPPANPSEQKTIKELWLKEFR